MALGQSWVYILTLPHFLGVLRHVTWISVLVSWVSEMGLLYLLHRNA